MGHQNYFVGHQIGHQILREWKKEITIRRKPESPNNIVITTNPTR